MEQFIFKQNLAGKIFQYWTQKDLQKRGLWPNLAQEAVPETRNRDLWPDSQKHLVVCYDITKNNIV